MNTGALIVLFFVVFAIAWAFWLIFKLNLSNINLGKLLSYFAGVILTLLVILWITSWFLPWWAVRLVQGTRQSASVQELQVAGAELLKEIASTPGIAITVAPGIPPQQPIVVTATPTISPLPIPETGSIQSLPLDRGTHIVESGDTLYNISRRYGVTVDQLKQRNNLTNDTIRVGQQLFIP
jgi:LysM repeat protein